jgi:putative transposase
LKSERLVSCRFATRKAAKIEILDYITYYNFTRLHSTWDIKAPWNMRKNNF